jgi:hypothetical protein
MSQLDLDELVNRWSVEAEAVDELAPNMPVSQLVMEGFELASFVERYWESDEEVGLPGLKEYVRAQFTEGIASELRELALAVAELQGRYNAEFEPPQAPPVERAEEILSELGQTLEFLFDDGVEADEDRRLELAKKNSRSRDSYSALAYSLLTMVGFAEEFIERLRKVPRFDDAIVTEGRALANQLHDYGPSRRKKRLGEGRAAIRRQRARVTRLLYDRMAVARRTIRFALSDQPELVQRATSQYQRERRQRWRAKRE